MRHIFASRVFILFFLIIVNIRVIFPYNAYTYVMKRKLLLFTAVFLMLLTLLPACDAQNAGSLKSITRPYIAQYECIEAKFGEENYLEKFDYIKLTLKDKENMEICYKLKNGERTIVKSKYDFDVESKRLTADVGILGYKFKQSTIIENGKFTISNSIGGKQLVMKFKAS